MSPNAALLPKWLTCLISGGLVLFAASTTLAQTEGTDPADATQAQYLSANGFLNRGLYELAVAEYRAFLDQQPGHAKADLARYGLAVCCFRLGRCEDAIAELTPLRSKAGFEFAAEVATLIGQCRLAAEDYKSAVESFRIVTRDFASHPLADDAAVGAIEALYGASEFAEAAAAAQLAITQWPDSPLRARAEYYLGLAEMARKSYTAAAKSFTVLLSREADGPLAGSASFLLAQCYELSDAPDKAIAQYEKVLSKKKSDQVPDALFALGSLLYRQGELESAAKRLDRLIEKHSKSPLLASAQLLRARISFDQGKLEQAATALVPLAESDDVELRCEAVFWLGKCELRAGRLDEVSRRLADAKEKCANSRVAAQMQYDAAVALSRAGNAAGAADAARAFRAAFANHELDPDALQLLAVSYHQAKRFDESGAACGEFFERYPDHRLAAGLAYLAAENQLLAERPEEALKSFRAFLARFPKDERSARAKLNVALTLFRMQRFDEAEPELLQIAESGSTDPMFAPVRLALGDIQFQRGDWKTAARWFKDFLAAGLDQPAADDALLKYGLCLQRQENPKAALGQFETLIERFPKSPHRLQAMFERGQSLLMDGHDVEAAEAFRAVLAAGDESPFAAHATNHLAAIAARGGKFDDAAKLYERVAETSGKSDLATEALLHQARSFLAAQQWPAAEAASRRLLDASPTQAAAASALAVLSIAVARQDRCEDAIELFERVAKLPGGDRDAATIEAVLYERAWCLKKLGRVEEASAAYAKLLEVTGDKPSAAQALLETAELKASAKDWDGAVDALSKLRAISAADSKAVSQGIMEQATYRLGVCEFERNRFKEAAEAFDEFLARYAGSALVASASYFAGECQHRLGRFERAVAHFARIVEEHPDDAILGPALLRLGDAQAQLQRWSDSEKAFNNYLQRFANSEHWYQAQFGLGWAREHQQRHEEAVKAYREVTARHQGPTAARAQFQIGECLFAQSKHDEAVRELLKVDILYAYPEWSAAALFEAGRCFEKLNKPAEAKEQFRLVAQKFTDSKWAAMASQRLSEISSAAGVPGR